MPDGRGVLGGTWFLPGPWLRPGFHRKGHGDLDANTATMGRLIDRFNDMLARLSQDPGFGHVRYVNVRPLLSNGANYRSDWANELHPSPRGFAAVAARIAAAV